MSRAAAAALMLLAAACSEERETPPPSAEASSSAAATPSPASALPATAAAKAPALAIEAEGLRMFDPETGSARPLAFGMSWDQLLAALAFRGPPGSGTNAECGAGPLAYASWPDGLTLYGQDGKFAGWAADARGAENGQRGGLGTAAGIGPGSTRAELSAAYSVTFSQTSLGTEFAAGELFGLLDGPGRAARISNMWAGASCNFR